MADGQAAFGLFLAPQGLQPLRPADKRLCLDSPVLFWPPFFVFFF